MANTQEKTGLQKFTAWLSAFLSNNLKIILIVLAAGLLVIVGLTVTAMMGNKKLDASAAEIGNLEKIYEEEWLAAEEEDKASIAEKIKTGADEIVSEYTGYYAAQKALMIAGNVSYELEEWENAVDFYKGIADGYADSFLAPISLMYAASAEEENGNIDSALLLYNRVIDEYPDCAQEIMRARFNAGRLEESLLNFDNAEEHYNLLIDEDPQDPWSLLAQSRLLVINQK